MSLVSLVWRLRQRSGPETSPELCKMKVSRRKLLLSSPELSIVGRSRGETPKSASPPSFKGLLGLSDLQNLAVHCIFFRPSRVINFGVLVVLHRVADTQRLVVSATRKFEQLSVIKFLMYLLMRCSYLVFAASCIPLVLIEFYEIKWKRRSQ